MTEDVAVALNNDDDDDNDLDDGDEVVLNNNDEDDDSDNDDEVVFGDRTRTTRPSQARRGCRRSRCRWAAAGLATTGATDAETLGEDAVVALDDNNDDEDDDEELFGHDQSAACFNRLH